MPNTSPTEIPLTELRNKHHRGQKQTLQQFHEKSEPVFHNHSMPNWATCHIHHHNCNCPAYKGFSIHKIQLITLKCTVCHCPNTTACPYSHLIHCLGPSQPLTVSN